LYSWIAFLRPIIEKELKSVEEVPIDRKMEILRKSIEVIKGESEEVQVFQKIETVAVDVKEQSEVEGKSGKKEIIIDENQVEDEAVRGL
jgi:hypothetical protein